MRLSNHAGAEVFAIATFESHYLGSLMANESQSVAIMSASRDDADAASGAACRPSLQALFFRQRLA